MAATNVLLRSKERAPGSLQTVKVPISHFKKWNVQKPLKSGHFTFQQSQQISRNNFAK